MNDNVITCESLSDVTPDMVNWLKAGSERKGAYITNNRVIIYRTKRGVCKSITCYVMSDGSCKWRSFTGRGNSHDGLTNEEAQYFAPDVYARRMERSAKYADDAANRLANAERIPVKVGDVFAGCYGYDATLWEFYEVISVSSTGKTVTVRELAHETESGYGYNDWRCRPAVGCYARGSKPEKHVIKWSVDSRNNTAEPYFTVTSFMSATRLHDVTAWHDADNYH